jgi:hypothetical protein
MLEQEIIKTQQEQIETLKERIKTEQELTQVYKESTIHLREQIKKLFMLLDESISQSKTLLNHNK